MIWRNSLDRVSRSECKQSWNIEFGGVHDQDTDFPWVQKRIQLWLSFFVDLLRDSTKDCFFLVGECGSHCVAGVKLRLLITICGIQYSCRPEMKGSMQENPMYRICHDSSNNEQYSFNLWKVDAVCVCVCVCVCECVCVNTSPNIGGWGGGGGGGVWTFLHVFERLKTCLPTCGKKSMGTFFHRRQQSTPISA